MFFRQTDRESLARIELMFAEALDRIERKIGKLMSGEDDLKAAVAALSTQVTSTLAQITTILNQAVGDPDADIEDIANQVNAQVAKLASAFTPVTSAAGAPPVTAPPTPPAA